MFSTKKYTRPLLLTNLRSLNAREYATYNMFVNALSPRAGANSAQVATLASLIGRNKLRSLFNYGRPAEIKQVVVATLKAV